MLFEPPDIFGLVLNVSLRTINGKKIADTVKEQLIKFVNKFQDEDLFYMNNNKNEVVESNGKRTALIGNWHPQEVSPHLGKELDRALGMVCSHGDLDGTWYLCLITDIYKNNDVNYLKQMIDKNHSIWGEVNIMVITIGNHYSFKEYESLCQQYECCKYVHLKNAVMVDEILTEWIGLEG